MLFNSLEFLIFLPITYFLYWFVFNKKLIYQNILILICSYIFYGWWDYRFLLLILLSTLVDYTFALLIAKNVKYKNVFLYISIFFNIGILGFFKYYNFFIDSWVNLLNQFNYYIENNWTLQIILPVGISFYTFQTMSYTIDIYRGTLKPTKDFISFAAFVSFFPQLVAGPIERASNLLPQILKRRKFNYDQSVQGLRLILWGLFKKVVVADSLSPIVDQVFSGYELFSGISLFIGAIYFSIQIYCDFSGYSDIAIGTSKLFGFELMSNFKFPYFSRNIGEFWRRWHISLSTWFRDYLYIPLGGSKVSKIKSIRNVFVIFLVSGFWHGANWTFIFWGLFHALLFIPSFIFKTNRKYVDSDIVGLKSYNDLFNILITYFLVVLSWIFFRSETLSDSFKYMFRLFEFSGNSIPIKYLGFVVLLLIFEWTFKSERLLWENSKYKFLLEYIFILLIIIYFGNNQSFIYFQF